MDSFNEHQKDVRARTDSLCKAVFVLSGGALTISMSIFNNDNVTLTECLKSVIVLSWWSLFVCIVSLVLVLFIIICRDYFFGERLRKDPEGKVLDISGSPGGFDVFVWIFSIIGLIGFIVGYFSLAYVATNAIGT